ncbi:MAG: hypothetical protein LBU13_10485 [Synergistaceae bacterium]|nr:hypothetical protein [Synergistaceae bacterium]
MLARKVSIVFTAAIILISLSLESFAEDIRITAKHAALPVLTGLTQDIAIELPSSVTSGAYDVVIEVGTDWGFLLFPSGPARSGRLKISPNKPAEIKYRWSGVTPVNGPVTERIGVLAPELGISGEIQFSVGVNIRITDVKLPEKIQAGVLNRVEIFVADAFNAELDLSAMMDSLDVPIEAAMTLTLDVPEDGAVSENDPVVRAFFSNSVHATSYPSGSLVSGRLSRTDGGKFIWTSPDGKISGITPPSPGKYHIDAVLKPNTGGPPLRHWSSPVFTVSENMIQADKDMPDLMASTLKIIAAIDHDAAKEALSVSRELMAKGGVKDAIAALGRHMRRVFANAPGSGLGRYAAALGASGKSADEIVNFLGSFVKGYEYGVLIFTRNGAAEWNLKRASGSQTPLTGNEIFEGNAIAAAPFAIGHDVTLSLKGSDTEDVSLWKLIPQGVNAKKYPRGKWIKEIRVYTTGVTPKNAVKQ